MKKALKTVGICIFDIITASIVAFILDWTAFAIFKGVLMGDAEKRLKLSGIIVQVIFYFAFYFFHIKLRSEHYLNKHGGDDFTIKADIKNYFFEEGIYLFLIMFILCLTLDFLIIFPYEKIKYLRVALTLPNGLMAYLKTPILRTFINTAINTISIYALTLYNHRKYS